MRYKTTFVAGLALGFVLGARAGRERYEQMARAARAFMENPHVRQAGGVVGQRSGELINTATHKVSERLGERVTPHLPAWAPGHRETTPAAGKDWAHASDVRPNGYGSNEVD